MGKGEGDTKQPGDCISVMSMVADYHEKPSL